MGKLSFQDDQPNFEDKMKKRRTGTETTASQKPLMFNLKGDNLNIETLFPRRGSVQHKS